MTDGSEMTEEQRQEELRSEIEHTRRELGETVEALSNKADVRHRCASARRTSRSKRRRGLRGSSGKPRTRRRQSDSPHRGSRRASWRSG